MKKPAKYVTTPVEVCKNYVKTMIKACIYILFTGFLQAFYTLYRLVTYFTYFLIKEQELLVFILQKRAKEYSYAKLLHIEPFLWILRQKLSSSIHISSGKFPLSDLGRVF